MAKKKSDGPRPEWHTVLTAGECYHFTDITSMIYVGRVVSIDGQRVTLEDAAWVSETGRLHVFLGTGRADGMQVEPVGVRTVYWAGWGPWPHALFAEAV